MLEVLSDFQVSIPELGTITATRRPLVILTSNAARELSEAVKRRCLYLYLDYPSKEREAEIVQAAVPKLSQKLTTQLIDFVAQLHALELKKSPSIAESIDWVETLIALDAKHLDADLARRTLTAVLKHHSDQTKAISALKLARK